MAAVPADPARPDQPFQIRGNSYTLMTLRLFDPAAPDLFARLREKVEQAPGFFLNAPMVIDVEPIADQPAFDLGPLIEGLRQCKLMAVGITGGGEAWNQAALAAGLGVMAAARPAPRPAPKPAPRPDPAAAPEPAATPEPEEDSPAGVRVVAEPVRSGQQVYAPGADLVVLGPVNRGAEVLADGHIHVYGSLRGRALAGIGGDTTARIFCRSLEAELVAIAGVYKVSDQIQDRLWQQSVQVRLDQDRIEVDAL